MKTLIMLPIIFIGTTLKSNNEFLKGELRTFNDPVANAGPDQTIYLTRTTTATLDGSLSSAESYQWTEISTDYSSGATITSPNSKVTTVTGLPQGVFYFKITTTTAGVSVSDSMKVIVDYDTIPANSYLLKAFPLEQPKFAEMVNLRDDTTRYIGYNEAPYYPHSQYYMPDGKVKSSTCECIVWLERSRLNGMMIDSLRGKFYTTIEDGYGWGPDSSYARSQIAYGAAVTIDTLRTYIVQLKMYFPQPISSVMSPGRMSIFGMHGNDDGTGDFQIMISEDSVIFNDAALNKATKLAMNTDWYNKTHTVRMVIREGYGYTGQQAFVRVFIDGVQKYFKNTGKVGKTLMRDYLKLFGLYDYGRYAVDPRNTTRHRKMSLVTMNADVYVLNATPTVHAGNDQSTTSTSISLSGTANDDGVSGTGVITSYLWTKVSGGDAIISNPNSSSTTVSGLKVGTYKFELKATDNSGISGKDTVQITVADDGNISPVAIAGNDKAVTLPTNIVSLSGNGTDADGFIVSYLWTKISGPTNFKIVNPSLPATDITGMVEGEYVFQLKVTDDKGAIGTSTVKVTVNPAPNIAPVAIAGADKTITLPTNSVSLSGSGTDADGSVVSYAWSKLSGPSAFKIANPSSATTDVSGMAEGVYVFELKVTDNKGATGTSTVKITVNPAPNIAPVAIAGANKIITLPVNMVSLAGSGSDADGKIVGYLWIKISGPAFFKIVNPSSPVTDVTGLVEGEYVFELKVTDDKGAAGTARVQISVKAGLDNLNSAVPNVAPKANAGNDTTVTAPVTVITLKGTGTDVDGRITGYLWTQISGPSKSNLSPNNEAATEVSNLTEGTYEFELKVTDNEGGIGRDTMRVTVVATRLAAELNNVKVNPNPVTDVANLEISASKSYTNFTIIVSDVGGKSIYRDQFASQDRKFTRQVNMSSFERGTYIITVVFDRTERTSVKVARM